LSAKITWCSLLSIKAIVKTRVLKPTLYSDEHVDILLYEIVDDEWDTHVFRASNDLIDKMLAYANNKIVLKQSMSGMIDGYIFSEVEATGFKTVRGEGLVKNVETILYPIPQPLRRIAFLKKTDGELKQVHEIKPPGEYWIYETMLVTKDLDYDAILIETSEDRRIVLREEIIIPHIKTTNEEAGKKRRRKRKSKKGKKKEKTGKNKTRKRRSRRRRSR